MKKPVSILLCIMTLFVFAGCENGIVNEYNSRDETSSSEVSDALVENEMGTQTSSAVVSETESNSDTETSTSSVITFTDQDLMITQFEALGFTETEAKEIQIVFENVGISEIGNITGPLGSGVNEEQRYVCHFYNFDPNTDCIKLSFTIVKKKIQRISICYSPYGQLGVYPESHKYKELVLLDGIQEDTYSDSVTLYYRKLKNMEVDENSVGYRAVYNYETHSVRKY